MWPEIKRKEETRYGFSVMELQLKQSKGETLSKEDKKRVQKFAESQRKANLNKKKRK